MRAPDIFKPLHILIALAALSLAACGGGGGTAAGSGGGEPVTLTITTAALPGGSVGSSFSTPLEVTNAQGDVTWGVAAGSLPPGLDLDDTSGVISGMPTNSGTYGFTIEADDGAATDTQALTISVGNVGLSATSGLVFGDAWTSQAVSLSADGATGSVSFSIVVNESGGSLSNQNGGAGTATYTPGTTGGSGVTDRVRATDAGNGQTFDLDIDVMPNPVVSHTASFGSSDVWWIDMSTKFGSHAYATDYHKALVDVGLRATTSTGAVGTEADEIAAVWFRVELLRQVNPMFLRNADGSEGSGLAITFPYVEPGAGYTKPAPADWLNGSPTRYSQMALTRGSDNGVIGTAFLDGSNNNSHENDTTSGGVELGVFTNQITPIFNNAWGNTLDNSPITNADIDALKALLYGLPSPGGRYNLIRRIGRGFAYTVAAVVAHEVGHSLGLSHTSPSEPGSIMNASALISPAATYAFTSDDVTALQSGLPGAGKSTGAQAASQKSGAPGGGVCVCQCRARTPPKGR